MIYSQGHCEVFVKRILVTCGGEVECGGVIGVFNDTFGGVRVIAKYRKVL